MDDDVNYFKEIHARARITTYIHCPTVGNKREREKCFI